MPDDRIKRPAYQWYPSDANGDEVFRLMSYEQQGIYRALLDHQWIEGSIPSDPAKIAGLLPKLTQERFLEIWPLVSAKFRVHGDDRLLNDRLEVQRRGLESYIKTQRSNARKRRPVKTSAASHGSAVAQPSPQSSTPSSTATPSSGKEGERTLPATRTPTPIFQPHEHRNHACCGVVCLHSSLFSEFERKARAEPDPDAYVRRFFADWNERYQRGDRSTDKIAEDQFDFWRKRWAESHPSTVIVQNAGRTQMLTDATREFLK